MANFNKVILMGNLTRDIELRHTQGGTAIAKFGMAINEEWEADFIKALCQGIAKSSPLRDVDSVFNMFSKNQEMLSPELFR